MDEIIESVTITERRREIVDVDFIVGFGYLDAPLFDGFGELKMSRMSMKESVCVL